MGEAVADSVMKNRSESKKKVNKNWKAWLKEATFYIHAFVYMLVRIAVNVTMTVQGFYLKLVTGFLETDAYPTPI
jgi:Na+/melibiose symporter-like transporter